MTADASQAADSQDEQAPDSPDERLVERSIAIEARPDTVWAILSQPDRFSRWMDAAAATFEARAGSPFRMDFPNFGVVIAGEIAAFDAEAMHLAATWGAEVGPQVETVPAGSTLVEFRVRETADGCQVDFRHGGFSSDTPAAEHDTGWRFHLGRLQFMANRTDLSAGLERTLKRWFEAWNETDSDSRLAALRECCFEDVEFRDEWAVARGVESLGLHIANCHRFMPGWRIEAAGEPRVCRGEALVGWRSTGPRGTVEGLNHVRAACDGRMRRVAGFSG